MPVISTTQEWRSFDTDCIRPRDRSQGVLMCTPDYFDVVDEKNYFMKDQQGKVDRLLSCVQWEQLNQTLQDLQLPISYIQGQSEIEDMVFSANAALCWKEPDKNNYAIMSRMFHPSRQRETLFYESWLKEHEYEMMRLQKPDIFFEGGGDAIWQPQKMLLWGGYGHRTTQTAYQEIADMLDIPILTLRLVSNEFYHLDTCFCILNEETVLFCPEAFDRSAVDLITAFFPKKIIITKQQGKQFFTGNCFPVRNQTVVMQKGDAQARKQIHEAGLETREVDLSEFIKSGGCATCLKLDI